MEGRGGASGDEARRDGDRRVDGDDEDSRARLRHEQFRVDRQHAETVTHVGQRRAKEIEESLAARLDQAGDVLERDRLGRASLGP